MLSRYLSGNFSIFIAKTFTYSLPNRMYLSQYVNLYPHNSSPPLGGNEGGQLRWLLRWGSPLPIPNREVKPISADGTAVRWESMPPPSSIPIMKMVGIFLLYILRESNASGSLHSYSGSEIASGSY